MHIIEKNIIPLLEFIKIDKSHVSCHFRCTTKNKIVISTVPFEPYHGAIIITWHELFLHPLESYNRYYHTPITIYGNDSDETILIKAFQNVANKFIWNYREKKYIYSSES